MQIEKLSAFNKRFFKKILGLQISQKRHALGRSCEDVAELLGITVRCVRMIEAGHRNITQEQFDFFVNYYDLKSEDLIEMSRITHVQYLMDIYKEIDVNYPT